MFSNCYFRGTKFPLALPLGHDVQVRAARDFNAGGTRVITKGQEFNVNLTSEGTFVIYQPEFTFGVCQINDGWIVL